MDNTRGWILRESQGVVYTRLTLYMLSAAVFAWPLASLVGVCAAALGAGLGNALGRVIARTSLRLSAVFLGGLLGMALVSQISYWIIGAAWVAQLWGAHATLRFGEAVSFGLGGVAIATCVRTASSRTRFWAIVEIACVALSFAQLVAGHRYGAIHRPFELADSILARGGDPTLFFFALGGVAALTIAVLLLHERRWWRTFFHLAILILLLGVVIATTRVPAPQNDPSGLGLRGQKEQPSDQKKPGKNAPAGSSSNPAERSPPVAVVLLHDDYSPPSGMYYFRQSALSQFNGKRLVQTTRADADLDIAWTFPTPSAEVQYVPPLGVHRATLETSVALLADHAQPFALESLVRLSSSTNPDPSRFRRFYKVTSAAVTSDYTSLLDQTAGSSAWTPELWSYYRQSPTDSRYSQLAHQIAAELPTDLQNEPMAQLLAITYWLGQEGTYSLRHRHENVQDPTADFLFGDRTGYCVHFAHSAALLLRTLGLPARVATGYAIAESARHGGSSLLLSDRDGHAWAEVFFHDVGWVIADVMPARVLDPPPEPPDPELQRLLGEMARKQTPIPPETQSHVTSFARLWQRLKWMLGIGLAATLVALLFFLYGVKIWRRIRPLWAHGIPLARVSYRAELDRLAELNLVRNYGESREQFARRVSNLTPSLTPLTRYHLEAIFGLKGLAPEQDAHIRGATRTLRLEVQKNTPAWKRFLGLLVPWSWIKTR